jgi:hypothetical protein
VGLSNHPAIVGNVTREKLAKSGQPCPASGPADRASRSTDGSRQESSGRLCAEWVIQLMGFPLGWTEVRNKPCQTHSIVGYCSERKELYAKTKTAGRKEKLSAMRRTAGAEALHGEDGGQGGVQAQTVLRSDLFCKASAEQLIPGAVESRKEVQKDALRGVRIGGNATSSPQGWESCKQRCNQLDDALCCVSREMALEERQGREWSASMQSLRKTFSQIGYVSEALPAIQEVWRSIADEEKKWLAVRIGPRVANRMNHNRVAQLKAAGNAIVPEVAAIFMFTILRIINEEHQ